MQDSMPGPWDHDLSRGQTLHQLSHQWHVFKDQRQDSHGHSGSSFRTVLDQKPVSMKLTNSRSWILSVHSKGVEMK